jgi:hypothetical protein
VRYGTLTIDAGDTFSLSTDQTGFWVSQGKGVASVITAGDDTDCELLGTVKARAINGPDTGTHQKEGPVGWASGSLDEWYATKVS